MTVCQITHQTIGWVGGTVAVNWCFVSCTIYYLYYHKNQYLLMGFQLIWKAVRQVQGCQPLRFWRSFARFLCHSAHSDIFEIPPLVAILLYKKSCTNFVWATCLIGNEINSSMQKSYISRPIAKWRRGFQFLSCVDDTKVVFFPANAVRIKWIGKQFCRIDDVIK